MTRCGVTLRIVAGPSGRPAERMRSGGESGPAIVPHKPEESSLIAALKYESNEMPPSGKLPDPVIDDFVKWVSMGAPDPRADGAGAAEPVVPDPLLPLPAKVVTTPPGVTRRIVAEPMSAT